MWLLLTAPLFSQALATTQAPGWLNELACGDSGHAQSGHDTPDWAQCGYCTLLLSSPALNASSPILPIRDGFTSPAPQSPIRTAYPRIAPHDATPRAPPLLLA